MRATSPIGQGRDLVHQGITENNVPAFKGTIKPAFLFQRSKLETAFTEGDVGADDRPVFLAGIAQEVFLPRLGQSVFVGGEIVRIRADIEQPRRPLGQRGGTVSEHARRADEHVLIGCAQKAFEPLSEGCGVVDHEIHDRVPAFKGQHFVQKSIVPRIALNEDKATSRGAPRRLVTETSWPLLSSTSTSCPPIAPVAPKASIFMI
nr:hypothetical protein [Marinicella sp. W31]MDC2875956.1 hypothetical protein [Marinicella sp. W31]